MRAQARFCFVLLAVATVSLTSWAADKNVTPAVNAAEQWLSHLDDGQFGICWEQAASDFKDKVTKAQWEETMKTIRAPVGKMESRHLISAEYKEDLPSAPPGKYVILQFQTKFANAPKMIETVVPMLDKRDSMWKVSGYFMKAEQ